MYDFINRWNEIEIRLFDFKKSLVRFLNLFKQPENLLHDLENRLHDLENRLNDFQIRLYNIENRSHDQTILQIVQTIY